MVFSSGIFLYFFLPLFLVSYYAAPRSLRSYVIALASYAFYGWWRVDFAALMLLSTVVDYVCAARIARAQGREERGRAWLVTSLAVNLGLLGWFKYANFGVETFNEFLSARGYEPVRWTEVILPVGISFYTFQTMSYTIDVYRGVARPVDRFRDFLCYVALFPQLVAGPIVRFGSIAGQLTWRAHTLEKFLQGVFLFQIGLAKKILLGDPMGAVADATFSGAAYGALDAWVGLLAYAFQIYFDFSGYSDMAIGLGLMIGFRFPINFDAPYRARGITDFWRRWHVSLSAWLRDYLYVPLGGNRRGPIRMRVNLMITMVLGGLWHGASWAFVIWGVWHGAWLVIERGRRARSEPLLRVPAPVAIAWTFLLVCVGWVFFRAETLGASISYFAMLCGAVEGVASLEVDRLLAFVMTLCAAIVWLAPTSQAIARRYHPAAVVAFQPIFVFALLQLQVQDHVPFLYYRF